MRLGPAVGLGLVLVSGGSGSVRPSPDGRLVGRPLVGALLSGGGSLGLRGLPLGFGTCQFGYARPPWGASSIWRRRHLSKFFFFFGMAAVQSHFGEWHLYTFFLHEVMTGVFCQSAIESAEKDCVAGCWKTDG